MICRHCGAEIEPCDCGSAATRHWMDAARMTWCPKSTTARYAHHEPVTDEPAEPVTP